MRVVIIGANGRNAPSDRAQANELVDKLLERHPNCLFVTTAHADGIGKFVREKCLEKDSKGKFKYQLALINIQLFVSNLSRHEVALLYQARNPALLEVGDVFYYFANANRTGMMEAVIEGAEKLGRPIKIFSPGDAVELLP